VALARGLERRGVLARSGGGYVLGPEAAPRPAELGLDLDLLSRRRRPLVRGCLDWSERGLHVAGTLGAALATRLFELGWIERRAANRSVAVTERGRRLLPGRLGVDPERLRRPLPGRPAASRCSRTSTATPTRSRPCSPSCPGTSRTSSSSAAT
jgi:hypothetical protein